MDYTARIKLKSGKYFIMHCGLLSIMKTNCKLKDVTEELGTMLILISHKRVQNLLDVSGIENYLFLGFDENKKFMGTTFCDNVEDRNFIISTQHDLQFLFQKITYHFILRSLLNWRQNIT